MRNLIVLFFLILSCVACEKTQEVADVSVPDVSVDDVSLSSDVTQVDVQSSKSLSSDVTQVD